MEKNKSRLLIQKVILKLEAHADAFWYSPAILILACLDLFVIILPMDGILISSTMLQPKKWWLFALMITIGSTMGCFLFAILVQRLGLPWLNELFPSILQSTSWVWTQNFFQQYGLYFLFFLAASPIAQQPGIAAAVMAQHSLLEIFWIILGGRLLKYLVLAYISSHAPKLLTKIWGIQSEIKETQVNPDF